MTRLAILCFSLSLAVVATQLGCKTTDEARVPSLDDDVKITMAMDRLHARNVPVTREMFSVEYYEGWSALRDNRGQLALAHTTQIMPGMKSVITAQKGMSVYEWEHEIEHAWVMRLRRATTKTKVVQQ